MELVLTGSPTTADEMERFGVVNKAVAVDEDVVQEALKIAERIAAFSAPTVELAKQAVKAGESYDMCGRNWRTANLTCTAETSTLDAGLEIESALYYSSFSLADFREGIAAFLQKRAPCFKHR